jgi:DNA-binding CsgD family transcriptional regulator
VGVEAVALHRGQDGSRSLALALALGALAAAVAGRIATADGCLARLAREYDGVPHPHRWIQARAAAWLAIRRGERDEARDLVMAAVDLARVEAGSAGEAVALHELVRLGLELPSAVGVTTGRLAALSAEVEGVLPQAVLTHTAGVRDGDADSIDAASRVLAGCGADLLAAEAACQAASAFRIAGRVRSATVAGVRAQLLWDGCEQASTPALDRQQFVLSDREKEVVVLAAEGLPTREIAGRLCLSGRTVDNHLARVYRRLGVSGRDGLAALFLSALSGPDTSEP